MREKHLIVLLTALAAAGCASQATGSSAAPQRRDIRALRIVPSVARACPGEVISTRYVVSLGDGSNATLSATDAAALVRTAVAATPQSDGAWVASSEPLESAVSGFRLSARLATDTTVRADTVVAPRYDCRRTPILVPLSRDANEQQAHVRIGTFPSPFYDSIVVAVVELGRSVVATTVLGPSDMQKGAILVNANGRDGRAGRNGRPGRNGDDCGDGEDGEDGGDGEDGLPGGRVDFIVQHDAPSLADLIVVLNAGGRGGPGGIPGRGGSPGQSVARAGGGTGRGTGGGTGGGRCAPKQGRFGKPGRAGLNAGAGPSSHASSVFYPLLWPGSPIWSDSVTRAGLEALIAYDAKKGG